MISDLTVAVGAGGIGCSDGSIVLTVFAAIDSSVGAGFLPITTVRDAAEHAGAPCANF